MWLIGPMWPKCAFGDQKGLIRKKTCHLAIPLIMEQNNADFLKIDFFFYLLWVQKVIFWVKNGVFGVFWTECEVADPK